MESGKIGINCQLQLPREIMVNKNEEVVIFLENSEPGAVGDEGAVQVFYEVQNEEASSGNLDQFIIKLEPNDGNAAGNELELQLQLPSLQYEFELPHQYFDFNLEAPSQAPASQLLANEKVIITEEQPDKQEENLEESGDTCDDDDDADDAEASENSPEVFFEESGEPEASESSFELNVQEYENAQAPENFSDLLRLHPPSNSPPSTPNAKLRRKRKQTIETINPVDVEAVDQDLNKKPKLTESTSLRPERLDLEIGLEVEVVANKSAPPKPSPSSSSGSNSASDIISSLASSIIASLAPSKPKPTPTPKPTKAYVSKEKVRLTCPDCKLFFDCELDLSRHFIYSLNHVSAEAQTNCVRCAKSFTSLLQRINHDQVAHPEMFVKKVSRTVFPTIKCEDCGHEFYAQDGYRQHLPKCGLV